jgi:hypothetical protein
MTNYEEAITNQLALEQDQEIELREEDGLDVVILSKLSDADKLIIERHIQAALKLGPVCVKTMATVIDPLLRVGKPLLSEDINGARAVIRAIIRNRPIGKTCFIVRRDGATFIVRMCDATEEEVLEDCESLCRRIEAMSRERAH